MYFREKIKLLKTVIEVFNIFYNSDCNKFNNDFFFRCTRKIIFGKKIRERLERL